MAREEVGRLGIVQVWTFFEADHWASRWKWKSHLVENLPTLEQFPLGGPHLVVIDRTRSSNNRKKKHCSWRCAVCGGKYDWSAPNRTLVVQLGTSEDEATVFRTHAVPQRLCENFINVLKLLANQQRDGDNAIQNIVTGVVEKSWERITNGLRSFIALDNYCAVEVGHLRKGQRTFRVKKPKIGEDHSEVPRERSDDLTLRAE